MAYSRIEPFGPERADLGHAIVAMTVANSQRDPSKKPTPFRIDDFMPTFWEDPEAKQEQLLDKLLSIHHNLGGIGSLDDE